MLFSSGLSFLCVDCVVPLQVVGTTSVTSVSLLLDCVDWLATSTAVGPE